MSDTIAWRDGSIDHVRHQELALLKDDRGWLCEMFRIDDERLAHNRPVMGYVSMTKPGVMRGPHEHKHQTDIFVFFGIFEIFLWDARIDSISYTIRQRILTRENCYTELIVPPGVVHGYRTKVSHGVCFNFPDKLWRGWHKAEPVDEIRHEDDPETQYVVWS